MGKKRTGLSCEYIIHPGETLLEVMEDNKFSQRELAVRTGVSEKHISKIINGLSNISASFAKKLEYVFGIKAVFWMNLQSQYDQELIDFEEINNISRDEIEVLDILSEVLLFWKKMGLVKNETRKELFVLDVRNILQVSNLMNIHKMKYNAAYRLQDKNSINPYVIYAWQRTCELAVSNRKMSKKLNIEELKKNIPAIKEIMFMPVNEIESRLSVIFEDCGICFQIIPNFKGAPVQGFIKNMDDEKIMLCMTIRNKYADIFWFTLFHEIGHILNGDAKNSLLDFENIDKESEKKADGFAENVLINPDDYKHFLSKNILTSDSIAAFAKKQNICDYIVYGRLMKDGKIPWNQSYRRIKYEWVS